MDYEEDLLQHQQYEDELYKDTTNDSEGADSDLEDAMLSRIYYSTSAPRIGPAAMLGDSIVDDMSERMDLGTNDSGVSGDGEGSEDKDYDDYGDSSDIGEVAADCDPRVKRPRYDDGEQLDEYVLDLKAAVGAIGDEASKYDLDAELGHLEDEDFKGRSRYYLEIKTRKELCGRCNQPGHYGRDCETLVDCPTAWREYVVESKESREFNHFCYNCSKSGHFGDECREQRPMYNKSARSAFSSRPNSCVNRNLDPSIEKYEPSSYLTLPNSSSGETLQYRSSSHLH
ncbi:hypothetical protein BGZ65_006341, partial [Modicella reniformis]